MGRGVKPCPIGLVEEVRVTSMRLARVFLLVAWGAAAVALGSPAARADGGYIDNVAAAVADLADGNHDRAAEEINSAIVQHSGDPLVHLALGTLFLHTRQVDRAQKEFAAANLLVKGHPLALYGLGLCSLASGKREDAQKHFANAAPSVSYEIGPTLAYLTALSGHYPSEAATADPLLSQITARQHFLKRDYGQARAILAAMVAGQHGFDEELGAVVTFDPAKPIALTGRPLAKPYRSPAEKQPGVKVFNGTVTLKANLSMAQGVAYVLFYVDGALVGIVNHSPYECPWNTTRYSNAVHTVKIEGHSSDGVVLGERSTRVLVTNERSSASGSVGGEEAKRVEQKLWSCLRLKPSRRLDWYLLAECAAAENDGPAALAACEHVVAIDPGYRDARAQLVRRYSPVAKYQEIRRVARSDKVAALTFDDGPNASTPKLLDILESKNVKATFFVVGSMAEANPELLRKIAAAGHEIENHTYSHRNLRYLPEIEIERELVRTASVIRSITGMTSRFFRPPGGHQNGNLASAAGKYGFSSVLWTVNCSKNEGTKADNIVRQVVSETSPGSIVLMHNVEDVTLQALPKVIDTLRANGYELVTLAAMVNERARR